MHTVKYNIIHTQILLDCDIGQDHEMKHSSGLISNNLLRNGCQYSFSHSLRKLLYTRNVDLSLSGINMYLCVKSTIYTIIL